MGGTPRAGPSLYMKPRQMQSPLLDGHSSSAGALTGGAFGVACAAQGGSIPAMSSKKKESANDRDKRRAKALRENLKRRKAQARDKSRAGAGAKRSSATDSTVNEDKD